MGGGSSLVVVECESCPSQQPDPTYLLLLPATCRVDYPPLSATLRALALCLCLNNLKLKPARRRAGDRAWMDRRSGAAASGTGVGVHC